MDHLSNSTDYNIFITNMEHIIVNEASIELIHQDETQICTSCDGCIFNDRTLSCEYSKDYHPEIYYKLLHYISTHHPEKLV